MYVVTAGCEVERAPVRYTEARQLGLSTTTIAHRLLPEQGRYVAHPVGALLPAGCSYDERGRRRTLAIPKLKRIARVTDALRQTHVRRLQHTPVHM